MTLRGLSWFAGFTLCVVGIGGGVGHSAPAGIAAVAAALGAALMVAAVYGGTTP